MRYNFGIVWVSLLLSAYLAACSDPSDGKDAAAKKRDKPVHLVEIQQVQPRSFSHATELAGSLRALRTTRIFNQEEGSIIRLSVYPGDPVRKGQELVALDDALLRAQLQKTTAMRAQAEHDLKRQEGLAQKNIESREQLEKSRTQLAMAEAEENMLKTRLGYTRVSAPFGGVISQRLVQEGDVVARHTHLLTLYDPSTLIAELRISELLIPLLRVGDKVDVAVDALADKNFSGVISRIHPTIDEKNRRGVVEVEMKPAPAGVMAGQLCRVTLRTRHQQRLVIPFAALQRDLESEYVYVVDAQSKVQQVRVSSGMRLEDQIEITGGLEPGSRLIVRGFFGLRAGTAVAIAGAAQ